jgi:uncharacterized membrane protein
MSSVARSLTTATIPRRTANDGLLGEGYFLNLMGPPSLALLSASVAAVAVPAWRPHLAQFCHQLESRTICLHGAPMGLCARCTGIYAGIVGTWLGIDWLKRRHPTLLRLAAFGTTAVALASLLLHVLEIEVGNATRFVFGASSGAAVGLALWWARRVLLQRRVEGRA